MVSSCCLVDMRKIGSGRGTVTAYPRQLEALIRLSEAHAKMRYSQTVEMVDVEEAKRYVYVMVYFSLFPFYVCLNNPFPLPVIPYAYYLLH